MTPLVGFDPKRAPTCWQAVQVFTGPDQVGAPYAALAYLHATSEVSVSDEKVVRNLRERAATIGGNGLLLGGVNTETGAKSANTSGDGTAVWIPRDSAATLAQCAGGR
jgi:hypothetical protein